MERLSGTDALFLSAERPAWHQHVGGLTILDPTDRQSFSFDRVIEELDARLPLAPKFKWKLRQVPLNLARPVWVEDRDFDLDRHVRRARVPPPGGPREAAGLVGQILSHQLDRRYPLWELWLLEGLATGRVAMLMKYHHCLLDGVAGSSLASVMFDLEPDPPKRPQPTGAEPSAESDPGPVPLLIRSLVPAAATPLRVGGYVVDLLGRVPALVSIVLRGSMPEPWQVPRTSFNRSIGAERAFAFSSVALSDVKRVKKHFGATVNDVVLALCAGALRRYLEDNGELPVRPLVSAVPISIRAAEDTTMDNQVSSMFVSLATDVADPAGRLRVICESSQGAKETINALRAHKVRSIGETAPPLLFNLAIRATYEAHLLTRMPLPMNTLIANVPGPSFDLYCAGARVTGIFSTSVIVEGMGLNITLFSYGDRIDFGVNVDPGLVPDPWHIADGLPLALAELLAAAGLDPPVPVEDPFGSTATVPTGPVHRRPSGRGAAGRRPSDRRSREP